MTVLEVDETGDPRHWYSTNLVGLSSRLLSSVEFNAAPETLRIAATRATYSGLFALLDDVGELQEAADVFARYMELAFGVTKRRKGADDAEDRHRKSSYIKLLQGWGFDANSRPSAVLKGWVESRFGIAPTFHNGSLEHFPSEPWMRYLEEKLGSRFHNNCIQLQLDLLYEYCQWCLERFVRPERGAHLTLFRGIERVEARFLRGSVRERRGVLRLNNLVSFSTSREHSESFGELIITARIPLEKVLFYPGILVDQVLNGEGEVLVIGGDFEVDVSYV